MDACRNFINAVDYYLEDYEIMDSCNHDASQYLIPKGTEHLVTYYGKPDASLRFSDHWNWFASSKRCRQRITYSVVVLTCHGFGNAKSQVNLQNLASEFRLVGMTHQMIVIIMCSATNSIDIQKLGHGSMPIRWMLQQIL